MPLPTIDDFVSKSFGKIGKLLAFKGVIEWGTLWKLFPGRILSK